MKFISLCCIGILCFISCNRSIKNSIKISGAAQGTSYTITYLAGEHSNYREAFDSIFKSIDLSLSSYVPASIISRINKNDSAVLVDDYFSTVFKKSMEVSANTNGLFDVTVAPIINAYGFGFTKREKINKILIDSLLKYVGYKKVKLEGNKVVKESPQVMLILMQLPRDTRWMCWHPFLKASILKTTWLRWVAS